MLCCLTNCTLNNFANVCNQFLLMACSLPFITTGLTTGSRGCQKKRFKDALKANVKKCSIIVTLREDKAKDKPPWRTIISAKDQQLSKARRCQEKSWKKRGRRIER